LDSAGFPAVVTAHFVPVEGQLRPRTTILIKFAEEVFITFHNLFMTQRYNSMDFGSLWVDVRFLDFVSMIMKILLALGVRGFSVLAHFSYEEMSS